MGERNRHQLAFLLAHKHGMGMVCLIDIIVIVCVESCVSNHVKNKSLHVTDHIKHCYKYLQTVLGYNDKLDLIIICLT